MGAVYRATDTKLHRDVAIKILPDAFAGDPDRLARFTREAQLLASLNHPNIAAIYGIEERAIVMELVEGEDLRGPLPVETALQYAIQIASALEAAHEKGIIHRDLKPANIRITADSRVKVLDFGLAAVVQPAAAAAAGSVANSPTLTIAATQIGAILGTAGYMAPEQARGKTVDKRADIWAFGCVLYEMLTGTQAFEGETVADILGAIVRAEPDWSKIPANTPERVRRVMRYCFEKEPAQRIRDIGDVRLELTRPEPPVVSAAPALVTRRTWIAAAGVGGLATGAAAGFFAQNLTTSRNTTAPRPLRRSKLLLGAQRFQANLAVSRDGATVAYSTGGESPTSRVICVRELGATEGRILPGTAGAGRVSFSPDGRWVAYQKDFAAYKAPINGGPATKIADRVWSVNDWAVDGTIVLSNEDRTIGLVSDRGGPVAKLSHARLPPRVSAQLLPGGKALLTESTSGMGVLSRDGHDFADISDRGGFARYVASGHILFRTDDQWVAMPFDSRAMRPVGSAVPLPGFLTAEVGGRLTVSLAVDDAGTAFCARLGGPASPKFQIVNHDGVVANGPDLSQHLSQVSVSPDGRSVLLSGIGNNAIWNYDVKRGTMTRLTFEDGETETPVWSPNGRDFVYASQPKGSDTRAILVRPADGSSPPRQVWKTTKHVHVFDWSADGKCILLGGLDDYSRLGLLPVTGGEPAPVSEGPFMQSGGAFSPDGKWIAYVTSESGRSEVYAKPIEGVGRKVTISTQGGSRPRWSRSGKELFYQSEDKMMVVPIGGGAELSPGAPRVLFQRQFGMYDVFPDGRFAMFQSPPAVGTTELDVLDNFFDELRRVAPRRE